MDAFGKDVVLIETVGVGQSEIEIAELAQTTVLAMQPGYGDSIKVLKAGVMEVADVFVVNKADRPGADRLRLDIERMLKLQRPRATAGQSTPGTATTWALKLPTAPFHLPRMLTVLQRR